MTLTLNIGGRQSTAYRNENFEKGLKHSYASITDSTKTALVSGVTGKRIRIWRMMVYAAAADKLCYFHSGSDSFPSLDSTKSLIHELVSSDGIPVFTCNDGDDFTADPSDTTNWYFYIVYSIV